MVNYINTPSSVWTTNGSGTFGNALLPATTYTPSAADVIDDFYYLNINSSR